MRALVRDFEAPLPSLSFLLQTDSFLTASLAYGVGVLAYSLVAHCNYPWQYPEPLQTLLWRDSSWPFLWL